MKYQIIWHLDIISLSKEVNENIEEGWEPQGGVCNDSVENKFYQAMIKK